MDGKGLFFKRSGRETCKICADFCHTPGLTWWNEMKHLLLGNCRCMFKDKENWGFCWLPCCLIFEDQVLYGRFFSYETPQL